jgi:PAS domain S-box-containing protein
MCYLPINSPSALSAGVCPNPAARELCRAMPTPLEEQLRITLASIGDAVLSTDAQGRIVFANKVALDLLRVSEPEILGKPLEEVFRIVNEFTRAPVENPVGRVLRDRAVTGLANHTILITRNGDEIPIDDCASPIRGEGGELHGAVLIFRDITARRQSELTTRLLASIVESSEDAIVSKDVNGIVTSWNRGAERIFGYTAAEMIGKPIAVIAAPGHLDEMPEILERIKRGERIDHYQTMRRAKDGSLVNVSLTVSPIRDASGRIIGASKIARDITAQVRAQAEIAEQRERLRVTLHSLGDAVISTDYQGNVTYLNPVAERLTGWSNAEADGAPLPEVFCIVNEETRKPAESPVARVLREGQVVGLANHTVLISRSGVEYCIDDSAAPIRDTSGAITGVVLVFRDSTDKRNAQKKIESQTVELRRAITDLNQFAYAVSHDLREPLRNIANYAELLVRRFPGEADSDVERFKSFITQGVTRMETLLSDILTYSLVGAPEEHPPVPVDGNEVLAKTLENLHAAIVESGAVITNDSLPMLRASAMHLSQLFQNLLSNAIKYRSSRPPRIHIRVVRLQNDWRFSVVDNGIGIEPQYFQKIFGVFKRLHGKTVPGTGIGLAICAKVVERYGGRIWVESYPGEGSTFHFTLPAMNP